MGKNKRWKRKAKRIMGASDLLGCDCFFCSLARDKYRYAISCYSACAGHIRQIEKKVKQENISKQNWNIKL